MKPTVHVRIRKRDHELWFGHGVAADRAIAARERRDSKLIQLGRGPEAPGIPKP